MSRPSRSAAGSRCPSRPSRSGGPPPPRRARRLVPARRRRAVYAEAEAPAAPEAWERVEDALGDPGEGARVRLPVGSGVVDVRTAHHLGVRTTDALVRFHRRALIGLPVALGHHACTPGADPAALTTTWAAWLAATARS